MARANVTELRAQLDEAQKNLLAQAEQLASIRECYQAASIKLMEVSRELAASREANEKLAKELENSKSSYRYAQEGRSAAEAELAQIDMLVNLTDPEIPQELEGPYGGKNKVPTAARVAVMLAKRK